MIEVAVRKDNAHRLELKAENFFGDKVAFVARINDGAVAGLGVKKEITVFAHFTHD